MNFEPKIMGIVNITPDSFYNGSRNMNSDGNVLVDKTLERVEKMLKEGAGYIDIGACSTRPGAECVDAAGEWKRLKAVLRRIRETVAPKRENFHRHLPLGHNFQNS